jgi:hypothetical protein
MFFYSLALCVIDLSESALYLHERCLQLAGLVVVIDTTDDLNSEFFPMNRLPEKRRTHSISIRQRAGI